MKKCYQFFSLNSYMMLVIDFFFDFANEILNYYKVNFSRKKRSIILIFFTNGSLLAINYFDLIYYLESRFFSIFLEIIIIFIIPNLLLIYFNLIHSNIYFLYFHCRESTLKI
jgi:hypothetical protein